MDISKNKAPHVAQSAGSTAGAEPTFDVAAIDAALASLQPAVAPLLPPAAALPPMASATEPRRAPDVGAANVNGPNAGHRAEKRDAPPQPRREPHVGASPIGAPSADARAATSLPAMSGRFIALAAVIAVAAGLGGAAGAAGFATVSKMLAATPAAPEKSKEADQIRADIKSVRDSVSQVRATIKALSDNVAGLRGAVDTANKANTAQVSKVTETLAKLNEGLDRIERTQGEPLKGAKGAESADRRSGNASPEITGSVPAASKPVGTPPQTLEEQKQQIKGGKASALPMDPIVAGWTLHRVERGAALIEGREGLLEVLPGDTIRGLGRIHEIKRQDGRWVVVTGRGLVVP